MRKAGKKHSTFPTPSCCYATITRVSLIQAMPCAKMDGRAMVFQMLLDVNPWQAE